MIDDYSFLAQAYAAFFPISLLAGGLIGSSVIALGLDQLVANLEVKCAGPATLVYPEPRLVPAREYDFRNIF